MAGVSSVVGCRAIFHAAVHAALWDLPAHHVLACIAAPVPGLGYRTSWFPAQSELLPSGAPSVIRCSRGLLPLFADLPVHDGPDTRVLTLCLLVPDGCSLSLLVGEYSRRSTLPRRWRRCLRCLMASIIRHLECTGVLLRQLIPFRTSMLLLRRWQCTSWLPTLEPLVLLFVPHIVVAVLLRSWRLTCRERSIELRVRETLGHVHGACKKRAVDAKTWNYFRRLWFTDWVYQHFRRELS